MKTPEEAIGNTLAVLILIVLAVVVPYGVLAFTALEANPIEWTAFTRWLWATTTLYFWYKLWEALRDG